VPNDRRTRLEGDGAGNRGRRVRHTAVGVPPVTVAVKSVDWLELMEWVAVRDVLLVNAVFQSAIRLADVDEPMPVTWS